MSNGEKLAAEVWRIAARRLKEKVHPNTYQQWFANLIPVRLSAGRLVLGVPEEFFGDWLRDYYSIDINQALADIDGNTYTFDLEAGHYPAPANETPPADAALIEKIDHRVNDEPGMMAHPPANSASSGRPEGGLAETPAAAGKARIISRYTFDNFVVGEENRYAYTAARRAAECPGVFNPLYIYGNTGTGKTHLLHAVAHQVRQGNPRAVVRYATCEEILNSFVESLQSHNYATFRAQLRNVDMLLVDDIHMLGKKGELQEQFFNAFNVLYAENRQIILTSDKRPSEIVGLEARLISRFEQGVTTEIYAPGLEVRIAILRGMQEEFMVRFGDDILEFIASRISSNVRRLRGALMRLLSRVSLHPELSITLENVEDILHPVFEEEHSVKLVTVEEIQKKVAEHYNLRLSDLLSDKRPKCIAEPRMIAMYLARKLTGQSFPQLGSAFGRNHATIMNAWNKVPELCGRSEELRRAVALLERQLGS